MFYLFRDVLLEKIMASNYKKKLIREMGRVWDYFYPNSVKEEDHVAFALGRILFRIGDYQSALKFFHGVTES